MIIRRREKPVRRLSEWHPHFFWLPRRYTSGEEYIWIWLQTAQRRVHVVDGKYVTNYRDSISVLISPDSVQEFHREWRVEKDVAW